jgi:hypothetical protein
MRFLLAGGAAETKNGKIDLATFLAHHIESVRSLLGQRFAA